MSALIDEHHIGRPMLAHDERGDRRDLDGPIPMLISPRDDAARSHAELREAGESLLDQLHAMH